MYPFTSSDKLVDSSDGYKLFLFMDVYSWYNQIHMHKEDRDKTTFMMERINY